MKEKQKMKDTKETQKKKEGKESMKEIPPFSCNLNVKWIICGSQIYCVGNIVTLRIALHLLQAADPEGRVGKNPWPPTLILPLIRTMSPIFHHHRIDWSGHTNPLSLGVSLQNFSRKHEPKSQ
jgi:hypothetical protein